MHVFLQRCIVRALHYSIYCIVYRILGSAFKNRDFPWKQIAISSTEKVIWRHLLCFFIIFFT
jgi:hypothetical protein